jgi:hypothetical protein
VLDHPPDFMNMQAIYARAMTQALAYPFIAPAVEDLFTSTAGSCNVELVDVKAYIPLEIFDPKCKLGDGSGTIACVVVRIAVLQSKGERSICSSYSTSEGETILSPGHKMKEHLTVDNKLTVDDKLILFRRVWPSA